MLRPEYIVIAALLSTVISYLWLQVDALRSWQGVGVVFAAIPLLLWGMLMQSLLEDMRSEPELHKFWYLEITAITLLAAVSLFVFSWIQPDQNHTSKKRRAKRMRQSRMPQATTSGSEGSTLSHATSQKQPSTDADHSSPMVDDFKKAGEHLKEHRKTMELLASFAPDAHGRVPSRTKQK